MSKFSALPKAIKIIRRPAFWVLLTSGPIAYFADQFFYWLNDTYSVQTFLFLLVYYLTLIVFFLYRLCKSHHFHLTTFSFLIVFSAVLESNLPNYVSGLGFRWYIHPEAKYLQDHCHPIPFSQDGKTYLLGLCDLKIDETGQSDFAFLYDTSGDAAQDSGFQGQSGRRDRKEWVAAIRQINNDDPNEIFEIADFYATHIYDGFYWVNFDDANAEGFIKEYGLPPPNRNNPYPSIFYPEPDHKK